jgi:phage FluMu gp28-like protein
VVRLYPYQQRWIEDRSRFKIAVKSAQIGYSFAAALEAVLDCIAHPTLWIVLSRGERQSLEFMEKVRQHARAMRLIGAKLETSLFENTDILKHEVKFANGSRIIGLPANPDTARGYTGNMILDEFAFHQHDREIWAAAFGRVTRGDLKLRVVSTPNGQRGKYYELAKQTGLVTRDSGLGKAAGAASPESRVASPESRSAWSGHWCDVHTAVAEGCPIDVAFLRSAAGDIETWQQEYECAFLSASDTYIPVDMIAACEHPQASRALPAGWEAGASHRELYFGYDVARVHDLAVLAVVERVGDVFWTRALVEMADTKFSTQEKVLGDFIPHCVRGAMDATGIGSEMAERLAARFPGRLEAVHFTAPRKQEMAVRMKRHFEERSLRIPDHGPLRSDIAALRRVVSSAGNIRFDADRTDEGHADRFWALALALAAAGRAPRGIAAASFESDSDWYEPGYEAGDSGLSVHGAHSAFAATPRPMASVGGL